MPRLACQASQCGMGPLGATPPLTGTCPLYATKPSARSGSGVRPGEAWPSSLDRLHASPGTAPCPPLQPWADRPLPGPRQPHATNSGSVGPDGQAMCSRLLAAVGLWRFRPPPCAAAEVIGSAASASPSTAPPAAEVAPLQANFGDARSAMPIHVCQQGCRQRPSTSHPPSPKKHKIQKTKTSPLPLLGRAWAAETGMLVCCCGPWRMNNTLPATDAPWNCWQADFAGQPARNHNNLNHGRLRRGPRTVPCEV